MCYTLDYVKCFRVAHFLFYFPGGFWAMYAAGELILYGRTGVCRVEEIKTEGSSVYYVLKPLYQTCSVTIPADSPKVFTRPILTPGEVHALIAKLPALEAQPYHNRNLNQLRAYYLSCMESHDCEDLARLAKSLYLKRQETLAQKKKFGAVDERFMTEAENLLFGEFAAALDIPRDDVQNYIAKCLAQA